MGWRGTMANVHGFVQSSSIGLGTGYSAYIQLLEVEIRTAESNLRVCDGVLMYHLCRGHVADACKLSATSMRLGVVHDVHM